MPQVESFKKLIVWQASVDLAVSCLDIVEAMRHPYKFTFANQLLRAAVSIPSNIAEGSRRPTKAYLNHLTFSRGSHAELLTLLEVISRRKLAPQPLLTTAFSLSESVGKMLSGLIASLEARPRGSLIPDP